MYYTGRSCVQKDLWFSQPRLVKSRSKLFDGKGIRSLEIPSLSCDVVRRKRSATPHLSSAFTHLL